MDEALWVGVDLGTQSARVAVVDDTGAVAAFGSASLDSERSSGGRHEQDPRRWWEAVGAAARQAFSAIPEGRSDAGVAGLSICSTSGTIVLTDDHGTPLSPALMYDDARAEDQLAQLHAVRDAVPGAADVQVSWALPKIAWLLRHHDRPLSGPRIAHSADHVATRLVGHRVDTDFSHALKSGYDVVNRRWNGALLEAAGVDAAVLPRVVPPGSELGTVTAEASAMTGVPAGTPVVAGMTDGCAAQIAAGALTPGSWNSVLGTTLVLKGVSAELIEDPDGAVYSHRHPDRGWLPGGASNVGAGVLGQEFAQAEFDALDSAARDFEPASAVIYPLSGRGERFPFVRPDATRFEIGTRGDEGRPERYAALLQGIAYVERLSFEHLAAIGADVTGEIAITGGGTRNAYWNQLRADVLGRALALPATPEPAFGMAVLASARDDSVTSRAARMVTRLAVVHPRPELHERFTTGYERLVRELVNRGYITAGFSGDAVGSAR
ncbi:sugar (pentulose or hexulose) kinase [Haloactinopolyspora alba]|uniref:Sugar (Pentulose or hexulose) kinase n=1 Tax=Haloactinopolyspora alba TaxID=648780 RepID=A0A2P8E038_9ACTN|nr:FGGY family carbohydrate kinase [Haloactinopolyspora alba]PSL02838.1 sugar (pentulose or hexulose) kinase [Haloactinopolyspora alba]